MSELLNRFGFELAVGFVAGLVVAIWVSPTTNEGFVFIIVGVIFLTIIAFKIIRAVVAVAGRHNPPKN